MGAYRVSIALIALIVIQLAFFIAVIVEEQHQRTYEAMTTASKMASITRSTTDDFFDRYLSIFDTLKSIDCITRQDQASSNQILHRLNNKYPEIVNFAAVKKDGDFFASGKPMPEGKIPNINHLEFFQRIMAGQKLVIMQPHFGPISKELVTGIVVPLEDETGQINGIIGVSIQFQALIDRWKKIIADSGILMMVQDEKGTRHYISPELGKMDKNFLNSILSAPSKNIHFMEMTYVLDTSTHPESKFVFSIFVPAHSDLMDLVTSRKDLIFLFLLMVITIGTLGIWFYQERQWIFRLKREQDKLRRNEEQFRAVVDNSADAIGVSKQGIHEFVNPAYLEMFGYQHTQELIGKSILPLIAPHQRERIIKKISDRTEGNFTEPHYETKGLKKDGTEFDMEVTVAQYGLENDRKTLVILRDITERNRLEELLRQSQKMEAIGTLAGGIAHDFNNILHPIIGFAEMLQEDLPKDSPEQKSIVEVLHAALRAKDLVKQILAFSRQSDHEFKPVRLQSVLKEALILLKASIPKTIDIQTDIDSDCGMVIADPTQLHQIIMNLATNAYHAMENFGGQLNISLKQIEIESKPLDLLDFIPGNYALLKIMDTGIGIEKEIMDKIFDPYFTTKETGKGTGLGLSVVQGIIKSCHGYIQIFSEPDKGTEVHVYLPIMKKEKRHISPDLFPESPRGGSEKILLVDDEEMIIAMEKQMLERLGYQVTTRTGSIEALEAFKANPGNFDLIITDMTMPNMTGIQLANKIKHIRSDIPVIICTGFSNQINEETCKKLGIQGYVMKPVIKREIARTIREVLEG